MDCRPIAIYLPQFYPIPENDEWWGKGFTEWTNVTKAKPLFREHYQPHLPTDLGFYDLRLEESRIAQAELAKAYGIFGFCYYHYWFNGRRILERPIQEVLESGKPDFPFMFCWANENWSRRWDGSDDVVLLKQDYSEKDASNHCKSLLPFFKDKRYIRVQNKPVFCIYKPHLIPNVSSYLNAFKAEAFTSGMEVYFCFMETQDEFNNKDFDAAIEFQPQSKNLPLFMNECIRQELQNNFFNKIYLRSIKLLKKSLVEDFFHRIKFYLSYEKYVDFVLKNYRYPTEYKRFPGLTPMWDNTARRGKRSFLFKGSTPEKYGEWLKFHKDNYKPFSKEENFIFINAWNEWAEGNHLEPCIKWEKSYLEITRKTLHRFDK